jgi:Trk K+ transport system NAD-binding subunit
MTQDTLVLGGGPTGLEIAAELATGGRPVTYLDGAAMAKRARKAGLIAHESTLETEAQAIDHAASTVVVATGSDARNLRLAATAPRVFGAERVVALVNDPTRVRAFDHADIETVCVSRTVARAASDAVLAGESTPADRTIADVEGVELDS